LDWQEAQAAVALVARVRVLAIQEWRPKVTPAQQSLVDEPPIRVDALFLDSKGLVVDRRLA
jgi:hypothetical protein